MALIIDQTSLAHPAREARRQASRLAPHRFGPHGLTSMVNWARVIGLGASAGLWVVIFRLARLWLAGR